MEERRGRVGWRCLLFFCGTPWSTSSRQHPNNNNSSELSEPSIEEHRRDPDETSSTTDLGCLLSLTPNGFPVAEEMNLAAALPAERHYRAAESETVEAAEDPPGTPLRVSLMRLLMEGEEEEKREEVVVVAGGGGVDCCVCMGRRKGSAFIPCGHTFCRVCARELWLNRGACPLCNRAILEILDIF